ncbi:MAG: MotA/TolQ/ExbB proton channel family protein [Synergistales bacterium]|nr:MotA/TolQ/ExbB proton channel family protein [Synergistales bacterium]
MPELLALGGWTMWGIALCSVLALALFLERLWVLTREGRQVRALRTAWIDGAVTREEVERTLAAMPEGRSHWLCWLLRAALADHRSVSPEALRELMDQYREAALTSWEKGLDLLATLARITPLLGLLGTVLGMIDVFMQLPESGMGNYNELAAGIWKALLTTAAGLSVAIPVMLGHAFLGSRVERISEDLGALSRTLWRTLVRTAADEEA